MPGVVPTDGEIINAGRYDSDDKEDLLIRDAVTGNIQTVLQDGTQITSFNDVLTLNPVSGWNVYPGRP